MTISTVAELPYPFADLALARRLERAEGLSNTEFVEASAKLFPTRGACWIEVAGAYALYDGPTSPVTQTFGLGVHQPATAADLEVLEKFFHDRGAPAFHEVSPLADTALVALLNERGYQPFEFTSVLFRPIQPGLSLGVARNEKIQVRVAGGADEELCARTGSRGWSESTEVADLVLDLMRVGMRKANGWTFLAELDGRAIATGALNLSEGVALLVGASTIPEGRKQGAQLALLEARLRFAADRGCDLALMGATPGSTSQRNAERHGFRIAYTRVKWRLSQPNQA